jgi:hypothetical protein
MTTCHPTPYRLVVLTPQYLLINQPCSSRHPRTIRARASADVGKATQAVRTFEVRLCHHIPKKILLCHCYANTRPQPHAHYVSVHHIVSARCLSNKTLLIVLVSVHQGMAWLNTQLVSLWPSLSGPCAGISGRVFLHPLVNPSFSIFEPF